MPLPRPQTPPAPDPERPTEPARFQVGPWCVTPSTGTLRQNGRGKTLTVQQMRLLELLIRHGGQVVSRESLIEGIWPGTAVEENALTRCVSEVRRALGDDARKPSFVQTLPKRGYRLLPPVVELAAREASPAEDPVAEPGTPDPTGPSPRNGTTGPARTPLARGTAHGVRETEIGPVDPAGARERLRIWQILVAALAGALALTLFLLARGKENVDQEEILVHQRNPPTGSAATLAPTRLPEPPPVPAPFAEGLGLLRTGRFHEAEATLPEILSSDPALLHQRALEHGLLACAHIGRRQPRAARDAFERAMALLEVSEERAAAEIVETPRWPPAPRVRSADRLGRPGAEGHLGLPTKATSPGSSERETRVGETRVGETLAPGPATSGVATIEP